MKRFALALAMAVMMTGVAQIAQAGGDMCGMCAMKMDAGDKADKLGLALDLNAKQKDAVKSLAQAKHDRLKPTADRLESEMKAAGDEFETGLKKVLTAKQWTKYEAWKDQKKEEKH